MVGSTLVVAVAVSVGFLTCFLTSLYFWRRRRRHLHKETKDFVETLRQSVEIENSQPGFPISKLIHHHVELDSKRRLSNFVFPRGGSPKPLFCWDDYPSLVNDAVENGWTQFAFTAFISSSPSSRSRLLSLCTACEIEKEISAEISWEVSQGSADFMQKIRLNSGFNKTMHNTIHHSPSVSSVIKTALPLPGPPLSSFPQESYFEITILNIASDENDPAKEGERIKLIAENHHSSKMSSESLPYFTSNNKVSHVEESKQDGDGDDLKFIYAIRKQN